MISKLLVANRGEIAIRAFRAAYEMGILTVAVYAYEDRNSSHRLKADESYQIGETGHPVRAYLSVKEIIRVAKHAGADAVYPGYGFLSENPELAAACAEAGITFVGPGAHVLELTGNKARAIAAAQEAGLPVLDSSAPSASVDELVAAAADMQFPLFVKAVSGGGGRGMRRVAEPEALTEAIEAASREAESAFGDPTVYLEQAVLNPRHIEVQILADGQGNVIHLFERDCSVQRRHQKVIELAPAPNLPDELRMRICADAVAFARQIDYTCAGTVEFLLDERGHHVFIEMQSPHPGRAHRHRGDHRRRPGGQPAAHRVGGDPGRPWPEPGFGAGARRRDAVPHHHRGPRQRLPARHGSDHRLPLARRRGHPPRRRHEPRCRDQRALRLDAGQDDVPWPGLLDRGDAGPTRVGGVPDPRRVDQHPVSAGRRRRSRLPGGPGHHVVHRRAAAAAHCAHPRRPWHEDAQLPRRGHGQLSVRGSRAGVPAGQAARARCRCRRRRRGAGSD